MTLKNKRIEKVGQILLSKKTTATDPCFCDGAPGRIEDIDTEPGIYDVYVIRADAVFNDVEESTDRNRITELRVIRVGSGYDPMECMQEYIADIDVDSASAAICAKGPNYTDHEWGNVVRALHVNNGATIYAGNAMCYSGFGDGSYGVYGNVSHRNPGCFDALEIVFIEADEEEEDSFTVSISKERGNTVLSIRNTKVPLSQEELRKVAECIKKELAADGANTEKMKVVQIELIRVRPSENDAWADTVYLADPAAETYTDDNVKDHLKARIYAYLQTPDGYSDIVRASHDYNWGDFIMSLPLPAFGLYTDRSLPSNAEITKSVKLVVDQDEWLMPEDVPAVLVTERNGKWEKFSCKVDLSTGFVTSVLDPEREYEEITDLGDRRPCEVQIANTYTGEFHVFDVNENLELCSNR